MPPHRGHGVRACGVGRRGGEGGAVRGRHAEVPHEGAPGAAGREEGGRGQVDVTCTHNNEIVSPVI